MLKRCYFLTIISILITNLGYAENNDRTKMFESCADELFVAHFGNQLEDYLSLSVKTKIDQSQHYEWLFEDCEKQANKKPISFNLKNSLYQEDLDAITPIVFERCADERYVLEFGDTYSHFLDLKLQDKMKQQIEYEWFVEACEDEYRAYPTKFKLKYY
ncbi:hypothetical protein [Candidatus Pelagibacter sp. HIMB1611]|uniref:hypothetical protein n=1 Tax=Candidatus Pelagibacter sp. HIMB1611 TaxID=3413357 RepID=UPI003F83FB6A